jgi:chromosome segregation ATPase
MSSTFDANEKLATQALKEAFEFRLQKTNLQESLRKAEEEIASMKKQYQDNLQELMNQLGLSKKESEALSSKLQNTLDEIEKQVKNELNYRSQIEELSLKLATLQTEVQTLMNEKSELTQKAHEYEHLKAGLEDTKIALDATEIALDSSRVEKTELEATLQESYQEKFKLDKELRRYKKI